MTELDLQSVRLRVALRPLHRLLVEVGGQTERIALECALEEQTGAVDVLIRNTTWTQSRDSDVGMDFAPTTYYDGQQVMGKAEFGFDDGSTLADVDGELLVLPVNFRWYEHSVVFRTLEGHKLAAAADEQHVCFEVDHWDATARTGWSVVVQGLAREVTNWAEEARLDDLGLIPWARAEWRPIWVRIEPRMISGRVLR